MFHGSFRISSTRYLRANMTKLIIKLSLLLLLGSFQFTFAQQQSANDAHLKAFSASQYPSATECAACHPKQYKEWSVSQHSYAQMSPIFNAMQATVGKFTAGTNSDFCIRCHTPVGMNLKEAVFMSNIDRHPTSREGVTCIACHRLSQSYGKISGRLHIEEGDITAAIYGPTGEADELDQELAGKKKDKLGSNEVHGEVKSLFQLSTPGFCGACHDVNLVDGFRLEEAFSEFKNSPANAEGVTCQDCHMGKEPGKILTAKSDPDFHKKNYDFGPAADPKVTGLKLKDRKLTNHMFMGPDYSVLPPSLFPLNPGAIRDEGDEDGDGFATIREWLQFDWKAGWGSDEFEEEVDDNAVFPERWDDTDERTTAREDFIVPNLELLLYAKDEREKLLRNGYILGDINVTSSTTQEISFDVQVKNGTNGHNVPTGFDAERPVWLFIQVIDADGKVIKESGDLDPNGDLRDLHSTYVHNHELPLDDELFSLQSKFITRNIHGGEREQVLPIAYSLSPLVFLRPSVNATNLVGRPGGARKHKQGIEPLGERWANYKVSEEQLAQGRAPFKALIQLKAGMIPVNLLNVIKEIGFDFGLSARDIGDTLAFGHVDDEKNMVIWNDSDKVEDNKVAGHTIIWQKEIAL